MKSARTLISLVRNRLADGIPRVLAGVGFVQDGRLHIETSTVLLHVRLQRCVIVFTMPDGDALQLESHKTPDADPMAVRCCVQLKHGDVRSIVRELAPLPLTELIAGLELKPGEILAASFELPGVNPKAVAVGFKAVVIV